MKEVRTLVAEVPSGKIEVVFDGIASKLQFNCACSDAWDYCQAACCRLRTNYGTILRPEEIAKFEGRPHPQNSQFTILQHKPMDGSCVYLEDNKCGVHISGKPWACGAFHCSPGGVGEGIQYRDGGWLLTPYKTVENIDDQGTVVDWSEIYAKAGQK